MHVDLLKNVLKEPGSLKHLFPSERCILKTSTRFSQIIVVVFYFLSVAAIDIFTFYFTSFELDSVLFVKKTINSNKKHFFPFDELVCCGYNI